jgi:putative transposase
MDGKPRTHYLPRLNREFYQGDAVIHWTLTVFNQGAGWLNESFHLKFRELLLHAAAREGLACPVYCLMPDHLHLVWMGLRHDSDQKNGMAFLRTYLEPLLSPHQFQPQPHDRVLREADRKRNAFAKVCFYILDNPVSARLVTKPAAWPFCGAVMPGYPKLHPLDENFWPRFWKLYLVARAPNAGNRKLPPRNQEG